MYRTLSLSNIELLDYSISQNIFAAYLLKLFDINK